MSGNVLIIEADEELAVQIGRIGSGPLSLDTESDSFHHYREKVCLVQMSFGGRDQLVDPLAGVDLQQFAPILVDPGVRKILHGSGHDLRLLDRDYGLQIQGLFDTQRAAQLIGERAFSLAALLEKYMGLAIDKRLQRTDWSRRPLTPAMQAYAAMDTRHLEPLTEMLEESLDRLGRAEWAAEEFERLEAVRWSGNQNRDEAYLRIKGAKAMSPRSRAVLRELFQIREQAAQARDVPLFRIMGDSVLIYLAEAQPRSPVELKNTPGMPRSWRRGKRANDLIEGIHRALVLPDSELPTVKRTPRQRPDPELEQRVRKLQEKRDEISEHLDLDPSLVANRKILANLARLGRAGLDDGAIPELRRWQAALLEPLF